jgi:hypothetical protein
MIREYCDMCDDEVKHNFVDKRLKRTLKRASIEVLVAMDGTWNKGHICRDCLLDVITKGKDVAE